MTSNLGSIILQVIGRAPHWIRRDLEAKDAVARVQAEETLAAMIADALEKRDQAGSQSDAEDYLPAAPASPSPPV